MMTKEKVRVHIRWLIRRDMPEVLAIEQDSFAYPWTEEDYLQALRQRNCIGMVAEVGETVVGVMVYELFKSRLHLVNFAVAPARRRRGVGAQLIDKLVSKLSSDRRTRITADVRDGNLEAHLFLRGRGFRASNVRRGFYLDSGEDAYRFVYTLPGKHPPAQDDDDDFDAPELPGAA